MKPAQGINGTTQEGKKKSGKNSLAVQAEHEDYPLITTNEICMCVCVQVYGCVSVT